MNRKAQTNQIFIYIVAVIVLGLIIFVGYQAISRLIPKMQDTERITFEKTLDQMLRENKNFGTFKGEKISMPSKYEGICFVDKDVESSDTVTGNLPESIYENDIADQISIGTASNVFFMTENGIESLSIYQDKKAAVKVDTGVNTPNNYICIKAVNGVLNIRLEGLGKAVLISE